MEYKKEETDRNMEIEKRREHGLYIKHIAEAFTINEAHLIANCFAYVKSDPAGLPAHNLMILVYKLARYCNIDAAEIYGAHKQLARLNVLFDDD